MALSGSLVEQLSVHLSNYCGEAVDVEQAVAIGGGSVNDGYRIDTNAGRYFVKVNHAGSLPDLFRTEESGLQQIRTTGAIRVPNVIATGEDHDDSYLLLEHIATGPRTPMFWGSFGRQLAALHGTTSPTFGLASTNYIGTLTQVNTPHEAWADFFIQCRLEPLVKRAHDRERIGAGEVLRFERLYRMLPALFPTEPPALLHGDLWGGNFLCDAVGSPVLIDPAVYFGHREMDLAMTRLFGGFEPAFYAAYHEAFPLQPGWPDRVELCNLYPLLVHVNLFGRAYASTLSEVLLRYV